MEIIVAKKYHLVGLTEPGEFQFGGTGIVLNHNSLTVDQADELVEKGYPHLKPIEEPKKK